MLKNRTTRVATLLLALTLITCCFVGSTFAKYTSSTTGNDFVTVAKWQIAVNGTDITAATNNEPTFDLFATNSNYDDATRKDVADDRVALGTSGSFAMTVTNNAEVNAEYTVEFTVAFPAGLTSSGFKFYSDAAMTNEITAVGDVYTVIADDFILMGATETINVYWAWDFAGDDTAVGILAQNGETKVTVAPTITVEQVD